MHAIKRLRPTFNSLRNAPRRTVIFRVTNTRQPIPIIRGPRRAIPFRNAATQRRDAVTAQPRRRSAPASTRIGPGRRPRTAPQPPAANRLDTPVREFLTYCRVECGFAPATIAAYGADLHDLTGWMTDRGKRSWRDLNIHGIGEHLRRLEQRGLEISSIARHVATVRVFGRFLESVGHVKTDPAEHLTQPAVWKRLPSVLGREQIERLLAAPRDTDALYLRDVALLELLYAAGLRASEIADLEIAGLRFDLGVARVMGKGSKERIVPVGAPAMAATRRYVDKLRPDLLGVHGRGDRVFLSRTGQRITRVVVWQIVKRHARRAGMRDVHPHTLRHCFATHLLAGGADLRVVQELLGHSNINTTEVYTHVDRGRLKDVVTRFHPRP